MISADAELRIVIPSDRSMYDLCMEQVNAAGCHSESSFSWPIFRARWEISLGAIIMPRLARLPRECRPHRLARCCLRHGIEPQFRHGEILGVLGDERAAVSDAYRSDTHILERERLSPLRVACLQAPGMLGDFLRYGKKEEALHECLRGPFLMGAHAGIDLRQRDGTRGKRLSVVQKLLYQKMPSLRRRRASTMMLVSRTSGVIFRGTAS